MPSKKQDYTTAEAAEVIGCEKASLVRKLQRNQVKGIKRGWSWYIPYSEVMKEKKRFQEETRGRR